MQQTGNGLDFIHEGLTLSIEVDSIVTRDSGTRAINLDPPSGATNYINGIIRYNHAQCFDAGADVMAVNIRNKVNVDLYPGTTEGGYRAFYLAGNPIAGTHDGEVRIFGGYALSHTAFGGGGALVAHNNNTALSKTIVEGGVYEDDAVAGSSLSGAISWGGGDLSFKANVVSDANEGIYIVQPLSLEKIDIEANVYSDKGNAFSSTDAADLAGAEISVKNSHFETGTAGAVPVVIDLLNAEVNFSNTSIQSNVDLTDGVNLADGVVTFENVVIRQPNETTNVSINASSAIDLTIKGSLYTDRDIDPDVSLKGGSNITLNGSKSVNKTSNQISFAIQSTHGDDSSPLTGNITEDLTDSVSGIIQKIYHNDGSAPTFPAGWVKLGSVSYVTSVNNLIYCEWIDGARVEYWIIQES